MPGTHAKLSASRAAQWLACPPSIQLTLDYPETTSKYAEEGTLAHEIAEKKLRKYLSKGRKKIECEDRDMDGYTDDYRDYVVEQFNKARKKDPSAMLLIEERLDFSDWVPDGFGTGDAVIIADGTCHIIDLKYGVGDEVSAEGNPQCRLYALGAISIYDMIYDFDKVKVHIFQPRKNNISSEELEVAELLEWGEKVVKPAALLADKGEGDFNPGEKQCRFCPARFTCKARAEKLKKVYDEHGDTGPNELSKADIISILPCLKDMKSWIKDIEDYVLAQMLEGVEYDGYKLVEGRANRIITDEEALAKELIDAGFTVDEIKRLRSLTDLEKLVGKKAFTIIAAGYVDKPKGKPAVAPVTDKRPEYKTIDIQEAFKDIEVTG